MRIFAVGTKILGGGLANIWGAVPPPGPNVEPPLTSISVIQSYVVAAAAHNDASNLLVAFT